MSGYVELTHGSGEAKSVGERLGTAGSDFADAAEQAKKEHDNLATLATFGDDKLGHQFMANLGDAPDKLFDAMEKLGQQLHTISTQLRQGVDMQEQSDRENFLRVNRIHV
ncbi:hypothetical protein FNH05_06390 [Amycolatopsis rhizosphaerae]|uniref:WXG100 family type VII secretion target n=1 Tax=Amycolatopsis rhizosphaerae TaxID=2053003 RepID=A0A558DC97_9PSEU|nr:hypothetical protein [Amycolatopsis rhizosphaerae]TVT58649.1 hypothetical protein FNH05_06390 [Amycolatopsis rhizosphaerae]